VAAVISPSQDARSAPANPTPHHPSAKHVPRGSATRAAGFRVLHHDSAEREPRGRPPVFDEDAAMMLKTTTTRHAPAALREGPTRSDPGDQVAGCDHPDGSPHACWLFFKPRSRVSPPSANRGRLHRGSKIREWHSEPTPRPDEEWRTDARRPARWPVARAGSGSCPSGRRTRNGGGTRGPAIRCSAVVEGYRTFFRGPADPREGGGALRNEDRRAGPNRETPSDGVRVDQGRRSCAWPRAIGRHLLAR